MKRRCSWPVLLTSADKYYTLSFFIVFIYLVYAIVFLICVVFIKKTNMLIIQMRVYGIFIIMDFFVKKKIWLRNVYIFDNNSILLLLFLIALWYLFKLFLFQTSELTCAKQNLKRCYNWIQIYSPHPNMLEIKKNTKIQIHFVNSKEFVSVNYFYFFRVFFICNSSNRNIILH